MLPGTHIWSRREARETSLRISPIWRLGRFLLEWAAQGAKAQIPGSARSVRQRAFGRPRRIPGGALHIRDQLHLVSGKFGEGQADHYIFPPVPCPMIRAGGDLDDRESRWQNRQTAMLARTRPGHGAREGRGRALPLSLLREVTGEPTLPEDAASESVTTCRAGGDMPGKGTKARKYGLRIATELPAASVPLSGRDATGKTRHCARSMARYARTG